MLGSLGEGLRKALRGRWVAVLVTAVLAYFAYHALHGQRGLKAWIETRDTLAAAQQELERVKTERVDLQRQVRAFQQDQLDRDLLEEELRKLGYVQPNEVIILQPDAPAGGDSG